MSGPSAETASSLARALGEKYEVKKLVGQGGFAHVYEVWDKDLERRLAVKALRAAATRLELPISSRSISWAKAAVRRTAAQLYA